MNPFFIVFGAIAAVLLLPMVARAFIRAAASLLRQIVDRHEISPEMRAWYVDAMQQRAARKRWMQRYRYARTHHAQERRDDR